MIHVPFPHSETWVPGGSGSFWGDGYHMGNDYYATDWNLPDREDSGQAVVSMAPGIVLQRQEGINEGYGNYVLIDHGFGITSLYAHLNGFGSKQVNDLVDLGDIIGYVGMTGGTSSGPHLHVSFLKDGVSQKGVSPRPSPIQTLNGPVLLCDGQKQTSRNRLVDSADIDRDGCVGILDFNAWLQTIKGIPRRWIFPDVNKDRTVNILDYNLWFRAMKNLPRAQLC